MAARRRKKTAVRAFARLFGVRYCTTCGARMAHFRHPSRWKCPRQGQHGSILAEERKHHGGGFSPGSFGQAGRLKGPQLRKENPRGRHPRNK